MSATNGQYPKPEYATTLEDALARPGAPSTGRTALIIGGGLSGPHGGVGFATAWTLAREGARVIIADRDAEAGERAQSLLAAEGYPVDVVIGDVADDAACGDLIQQAAALHGGFDALVTTVGRGDLEGILEADPEQWEAMLSVNLTAAWNLIRHSTPILPRGASIVTTSSGAAVGRGPATPYSVAKAALEHLTIGAAATLAPRGIRVNAVRVGTIWSSFAARAFDEELRALRIDSVPLRTEGTVWDIAAAIAFLTGDRARWITGQVLPVDGGGLNPAPPGHRTTEESTGASS